MVLGKDVVSGQRGTLSGRWVNAEWTWSGHGVDAEQMLSGRWVDPEWTWTGHGVDTEWMLGGHRVDTDWA